MALFQLVSLTDPPPEGFRLDPEPSLDQLSRRPFCLYSENDHRLDAFMASVSGPVADLLAGVLVVRAATPSREYVGRCLYRLGIPDGMVPWLSIVAASLLEVIERQLLDSRKAEALACEQRYRLLADNVSDVIWSVDLGMSFTYVSPSAVKLHQWSAEEWLSLQVKDVVTPESFKQLSRALSEELARDGLPGVDPNRSRVMEIQECRKDGSQFWAELRAAFIRDEEGRPVGIMGVTRDISERRQAEAEKQKLEAQLLQSQKLESVGRLAGGIAHEFNNMLTPILGYGDMLIHDLGANDPSRPMAQQIVVCARRCRDLVSQLLAFARKQTLEIKPVDLNEVISSFTRMLRRALREDIVLEPVLSPSASQILGDRAQIEQVILNLAVNAQDAMPHGGTLRIETAEVSFGGEAWGDEDVKVGPYVMLLMSDTGQGMDQETVRRVFDPFFTTREVGKGTGLGLSTVYGIVKQHGGHIRVVSEPGRGSQFHLYFPKPQESLLPAKPMGDDGTLGFGTETVLIVEDEDQVRDLAVRILKRQGYRVLQAQDGLAALEILEAHEGPLDLLLTDVVLPNMSGMELWQRLHGRRHDLKVIFMSGYPVDVVGDHGVLDGGVPYLQKPFSIRSLAERVRDVLST